MYQEQMLYTVTYMKICKKSCHSCCEDPAD